jgi:hypothetical protein
MMNFARRNKEFSHILGDAALKGSTLAQVSAGDDDMVEFLVTSKKQPNYYDYCNSLRLPSDPVSTINQYTDHTNKLYVDVNLALAADSPYLKTKAEFISDLRSSILSQPLLDDGILYRGVDLSKREIEEMERLRHFFIPSFTSTSVDKDKAYAKSALLIVKTPFCCKYACSITPELSKFYHTEREVLLACYSAFSLEKVEMVNGTSYVTLWLDEYNSSQDKLLYN